MSSWTGTFNKDIREKVKASKIEYNNYKDTSRIIYLQQACEKLFSAVENFLMVKYQKRVRSYGELYNKIITNNSDREFLAQAVQLHYFFYNGTLQTDEYSIQLIYKSVLRRLEGRL